MMMPRYSLLLFLLAPCSTLSQISVITIPDGTPLPVKIGDRLPMKAGEPVRAELIYPVYVGDQLVLPGRTVLTGTVLSLSPDRTRRIHARLRGDFTPFHIPIVQFDHILLADGTSVPLATGSATNGAPIYRLVAPPPRKGSFAAKQFAVLEQGVKDRLAVITGPDKGDRFTQFVMSQLPYHPERIVKDTAWTVETAGPFALPESSAATAPTAQASLATHPNGPTHSWTVQAYLTSPISSATSTAGQTISATVAEPILNSDGSMAVPAGSIMTGSVTQAKSARSFGRAGTLRFSFRELTLPGEDPVAVQAALTGADSATGGDMAMNSEGEVSPKPQDKVVVPLILLALARSPLHRNHHHEFGSDAVASNSIGLIGFIVGTVAQQPYLAAGIGYYGAAISIYERIFHRGKEVAFARDTRIVIQTTARRSAALKSTVASAL
jgi:hypothetical protein